MRLSAQLSADFVATVGLEIRCQAPANLDSPNAGPYERLTLLGEGGMGQVWRARHVVTGREVALKELRADFAHDATAQARFASEATLMQSLAHPNVVEIFDARMQLPQRPYLVMELLEGESLAQAQERGPLPLAQSLEVARQLAEGLRFVHSHGVIHRDLKPENVFLASNADPDARVKLLDFGVAKHTEAADAPGTAAGVILGTPEYMSPEQLSGGPLDHRADIYAFGVILYELLAGQKPFLATTFGEIVLKHLTHTPVPPSLVSEDAVMVPEALEDLALACLAKCADDRPQSMDEVLLRLQSANLPHSVTVQRLTSKPTMLLGAATCIMALLIALAVPWAWSSPKSRGPQLWAAGSVPLHVSPAPISAITVHFSSSPSGAAVFLDGHVDAIGQTPFAWQTQASTEHSLFEFRLPGHVVVRHDFGLARDTNIAVTMAKPPVRPKALVLPPATAQLMLRQILDPFNDD